MINFLKTCCTSTLIVVVLCLACHVQAQDLDFHLSTDDYDVSFPKAWKYERNGSIVNIKLPCTSSSSNPYLQIQLNRSPEARTPIYMRAMKDQITSLPLGATSEYYKKIKTSQVNIGGLDGYLVEIIGENVGNVSGIKDISINKDYFLEYDFLTTFKIMMHAEKRWYDPCAATIEKILQSIRFHPLEFELFQPKTIVVETTEKEIRDVWLKTTTSRYMQDMNKLDSILHELGEKRAFIRLTDSGMELKNWADFFDWKSRSNLADRQVYSYEVWGDRLDIFTTYLHLGDYKKLRIKPTGANKLNFLFEKENGASIHWILTYRDVHKLPLNTTLLLDRFLFINNESYSYDGGKTAYIMRLLLNNEVYQLNVSDIIVY